MAPTVDTEAPRRYHIQRPGQAKVRAEVEKVGYRVVVNSEKADRFVSEVADRLERAERLLAQAVAFVPDGHPVASEYHDYQLRALDQGRDWDRIANS